MRLSRGVLVFAVVCLSGCGLEVYPYLSKPVVSSPVSVTDQAFSFSNPGDNPTDIFEGYEIYYKFYLESNYLEKIQSDIYRIDTAINAAVAQADSILTTNGFFRATAYNSSDKPLIAVPDSMKTAPFSVTIDFLRTSVDQVEYPVITYGSTTSTMYRAATTITHGDNKTFLPNDFLISDIDIKQIVSSPYPSRLALCLYATAYGNYNLERTIYSDPVYLGVVWVDINL